VTEISDEQMVTGIGAVMGEADVNGDGDIDLDEFSLIMTAQMTEQGLPAPSYE
jgi:hypothetical protein